MGVHQVAGDRQSQAAAARVGGASEALEDAVELVGGNAGPVVGHGEQDALVGGGDGDGDGGAGVADGVGEQVGQNLTDSGGVDVDLGEVTGHGRRDDDPLALGQRGVALHRVSHQRRGAGPLVVQGQPAGVGQGEGVEIVHKAPEQVGLLQQRAEVTVVAGVDAVELGLDAALQHGQGRAQLVGDVGEEAAALLLGGVQPDRHLVERLDQGPQLAGPSGSTFTPWSPWASRSEAPSRSATGRLIRL